MQYKIIVPMLAASLWLGGCSGATATTTPDAVSEAATSLTETISEVVGDSAEDTSITVNNEKSETYTCDEGDSHAIEVDVHKESYQNILVEKSGDSEGDEADFYGSNAAVL